MTKHMLTFMGTAAGCGVPSFFCDCPACTEARENPKLARGDCGIMIRGFNDEDVLTSTVVIDTPPDARHQLIRENIKSVDEILFTHCHFDHIGGLGEYEYLVQLRRGGTPLPTFGAADTIDGISREFAYMTYCLDFTELKPFDKHVFDGVEYTALSVTHAPGTYGYLIKTPTTSVFYASDTGPLPSDTADAIKGVDILAMDATYWLHNWTPQTHHSIQECIEEGFALNAKKIYLTHMCMHYDEPITYAELVDYLKQYNGRVECAMDGLSIEI